MGYDQENFSVQEWISISLNFNNQNRFDHSEDINNLSFHHFNYY